MYDLLENVPNGILAGVGFEESRKAMGGGSAEVGVDNGVLRGLSDKGEQELETSGVVVRAVLNFVVAAVGGIICLRDLWKGIEAADEAGYDEVVCNR